MKIIVVVLLFMCGSVAYADTTSTVGVYGGTNWNYHSADFAKLIGIPNCCPYFESGIGRGLSTGLLYEFSGTAPVRIGLRLGVQTLGGMLRTDEQTMINLPSGPTVGTFEHRLTGIFTNLGLETRLLYQPIKNLQVAVGIRFGYNITSNFEQIETLNGPGTFLDDMGNDTKLRTRNAYSGPIPNANKVVLAGIFGIGYELPLNSEGNLRLVPEVNYSSRLTELVTNTQWRVDVLSLGLAIKYSKPTQPAIEKIKREQKYIDTITVPRKNVVAGAILKGAEQRSSAQHAEIGREITTETLRRTDTLLAPMPNTIASSITAVGIDSMGREIRNPVIRITEYTSNRLDPLLNYIFFRDNSAELPMRYKRVSKIAAQTFEVNDLFRDSTLDIYYSVLNIVGSRMVEYPNATLKIVGCNAGIGTEKDNNALSQSRAEAVRDYLRDTWSIASDRLMVEVRGLPTAPSVPIDDLEKAEENRRVELVSSDERITESVYIRKVDRSTSIPRVRFYVRANAPDGLDMWSVTASQRMEGGSGFTASGTTSVPANIDWYLERDQKVIPQTTARVYATLHVTDSVGNAAYATDSSLQVEVVSLSDQRFQRIGGYEVERFSLILFDFDKATIDGANLKIVEIVKRSIRKNSEIEIVAYTDRTGLATHNTALSQRRAQATKLALGNTTASAKGIGADVLLYDNNLPEGRFYCRTVTITVRTPVE